MEKNQDWAAITDMVDDLTDKNGYLDLGIWDISSLEKMDLNPQTPKHKVEAFLRAHPNAIGFADYWSDMGWLLSEKPTKSINDMQDTSMFNDGMFIMDTKGALRLLFNLDNS